MIAEITTPTVRITRAAVRFRQCWHASPSQASSPRRPTHAKPMMKLAADTVRKAGR